MSTVILSLSKIDMNVNVKRHGMELRRNSLKQITQLIFHTYHMYLLKIAIQFEVYNILCEIYTSSRNSLNKYMVLFS